MSTEDIATEPFGLPYIWACEADRCKMPTRDMTEEDPGQGRRYHDDCRPEDDVSRCPACGNPIDYCQGHGEIGDPIGFTILREHDDGDHERCYYSDACDR